jgi:hypothetical protein
MSVAVSDRRVAGTGVAWRAQRGEADNTTEGGRDKRAHIAPRTVGCFYWVFRCPRHIAQDCRNVPDCFILLFSLNLSHIVELRHE